jgi:hypothetical protein
MAWFFLYTPAGLEPLLQKCSWEFTSFYHQNNLFGSQEAYSFRRGKAKVTLVLLIVFFIPRWHYQFPVRLIRANSKNVNGDMN